MDHPRLDGPMLPPMSGVTKQLVVLLHGYGADGADLIGLGQQWQQMMPDALFIAPNAPQTCENQPMGYQWFPLTVTMRGVESSPEERLKGAEGAAPGLHAFLDQLLEQHSVGADSLALVGFSQGAMMALYAGLRRPQPPACIVSYSGMLLGTETSADFSGKPPVFLAHGSMDEVVPFAVMQPTQKALEQAGIVVTPYVEQGIGHGIDGEAAWLGGQFINKALNG